MACRAATGGELPAGLGYGTADECHVSKRRQLLQRRPAQLARDIETLCARCRKLVIVSDDLYSDARRFDAWTQGYCAGLGLICRRAAAACDVAVEVTADFPICWKGAL